MHSFEKTKSSEPISTEVPPPSPPNSSGLPSVKIPSSRPITPDVVVMGSVAMDLACNYAPFNSSDLSPQLHTSNPATFGVYSFNSK